MKDFKKRLTTNTQNRLKDKIFSYSSTLFFSFILMIFFFAAPIFAQQPSSSNYKLQDYTFGTGGTENSTSENYSLFGVMGEVEFGKATSTNFQALEGLTYTIQSDVPPAPTLTNPSNYYNKLLITLNQGNNPPDTKYAVAISEDNFVSDTRYVQNDGTVDSILGPEDWQTYTEWGGTLGSFIIGLNSNTTYTVKIAAMQGDFTQSDFSLTSQASTSQVSLSFDIDVSSVDEETSPPYILDFGELALGSVNTADDKIWFDLSTNAEGGAYIYIYDTYAGLKSSSLNYTISSITGNLDGTQEGFGIRSDSTSQLSGGPITAESPYNNTDNNVGLVDTTIRTLYNSSGSPVISGRASVVLKAKLKSTTPSSNDYTDSLTIIASSTF